MTEREEQTVYIGKKPTMNYVLAAVTIFNNGYDELAIKARGRAISRAVDVAEIVRKRFVENVNIKDIKISTENIQNEKGETAVSSIEIYLYKKK
jgi:DNA-binding protein